MNNHYTWVEFYEELAHRLLDWQDKQQEIIAFLEECRAQGMKITPLMDQDEQGAHFLLQEIDPFTFFGVFNRGIKHEQRLAILAAIKQRFHIASPLPADFDGLPILNNQHSWFIAYRFRRQPDDVRKLWQILRIALNPNPLDERAFIPAFDEALTVWGTNINLTIGLFWIRPTVFVNLDQHNRHFLGIKLPSAGLSGKYYVDTIRAVLAKGQSIPEISYQAWMAAQREPKVLKHPAASNYWFVGAYWDGNDPPDQTQRFIEEGIWENGYEDKYLDEVRAIRIGDRMAIKAVGTQKNNLPFDARGHTVSRMIVKAIGTVVANRGDGRLVEVEWEPDFTPRDWYFYTYQKTIWRLKRDNEYARRLIDFVFGPADQDYGWFCERWWGSPARGLPDEAKELAASPPYAIADMLAEGVFMDEEEIRQALDRLRSKKNLILQGPPGVGKTFIARKLACALMRSAGRSAD